MDTPRFDPLWRSLLTSHAGMVRHANGMRTAARLFRQSAYRFASALLTIQKHHHNKLLDQVQSTGATLDDWLDEHFEPIEQMGGDRRRLLADIEAGMTEAQYVEQFDVWGIKKRATTRSQPAKADTESKVEVDTLPLEDQVTFLKKTLEASQSELRQLRRDNATLLRDNEQLRADFARLERLVSRRQRKTA